MTAITSAHYVAEQSRRFEFSKSAQSGIPSAAERRFNNTQENTDE